MADVFDYLTWRGDITFSQLGVNDVDALIFSALAYIQLDGILTEDLQVAAPLQMVAKTVLAMPDAKSRCRVEKDLALLEAAADSKRFGHVGITFYRSVFVPQEETQFAAMTFLLDDGSAFLAFRGTDSTLVGWKEDFNMAFQPNVPAQRLAQEYVQRFAARSKAPLHLAGHSKGGNLAMYAGAKCGVDIRERVKDVYNFDGPGFTEGLLSDPGYQQILPKVRTLVPQFSVFGMMLERQEGQSVVLSSGVGLLQHDPYTWQLIGKEFVPAKALTEGSVFLERTLSGWLAGLSNAERGEFFDAVFSLLMLENASQTRDVLRPQNMLAALKTIHLDEEKRRMMGTVLQELLETAKAVHTKTEEEKALLKQNTAAVSED